MTKRKSIVYFIVFSFFTLGGAGSMLAAANEPPTLEAQGNAVQLIVDGKPFLVRVGELGNSTASNMDYLGVYWEKFSDLNMNTVVAPVYWDMIEPSEGEYDFKLVDDLIHGAEKHKIKLVLLWFGSWKNSMSSYVPAWVKTDVKRFPRARNRKGQAYEILSPFYSENSKVDAKSFGALMAHLKRVDKRQTVIMVQPENEIGMVNSAREYSDAANKAFVDVVPKKLMAYLAEHKSTLTEQVSAAWSNSNFKTNGTWEEVFGSSAQAEEIFMAWHYCGSESSKLRLPLNTQRHLRLRMVS